MIDERRAAREGSAGRRLGLAAIALAAGHLLGPATAAADETPYEADGTKVSSGLAATFGAFASCPACRKTDREWVEGSLKPSLGAQQSLGSYGTGYTLLSLVAQGTRGDGDAASSLPQQGLGSTTGHHPTHVDLEDAVASWRSGDLLKDSLGADAVDVSYGNQDFLVGDGLVIGLGTYDAFRRGAFYTSLATAFQRTAILKLNPEGVPLRGNVFKLETNTDQHLMQGFDQPLSKLAGFNAEWYRAGAKKEGDDAPPPDVWTLGLMYFNIYDADSNSTSGPTGAFSFAPGKTASSLSAAANRDGLNVVSLRAAGSFLEFDRDILFYGEYIREENGSADREVNADAWYIEPGYKFSQLPWTPQVSLRYAQFSGESDPHGRVKHSYDPLFYTAGPRGYGSWYMGEIYGWYLGTPSNIDVAMAAVSVTPRDDLTVGLIFYDFRFDHVGQFANPAIRSSHALDETDLYAVWTPAKWLTLSGVLGFGVPGEGFKQAAAAFVAANGPAGRSVGSTMLLGELVAAVKF